MSKTFSQDEVASHNKASSLWIVIDGNVYDLTKFQDEHPGGKKILQRVAGKDASKQFWKYHNEGVLKKYRPQLQIGSLDGVVAAETKEEPKKEAPPPEKKAEPPKTTALVKQKQEEPAEAMEPFGSQIPFADPNWYQGVSLARFAWEHATSLRSTGAMLTAT